MTRKKPAATAFQFIETIDISFCHSGESRNLCTVPKDTGFRRYDDAGGIGILPTVEITEDFLDFLHFCLRKTAKYPKNFSKLSH
jgi:hypothetical protein